MQTFNDQVKMLYREHATALGAWKVEKRTLEKRVSAMCMALIHVCGMVIYKGQMGVAYGPREPVGLGR